MCDLVAATPTDWWQDTTVEVPAELDSPSWRSPITHVDVAGGGGAFRVAELLAKLPGAVLTN
jgi:hypothetical protein